MIRRNHSCIRSEVAREAVDRHLLDRFVLDDDEKMATTISVSITIVRVANVPKISWMVHI